MQRESRRVTVEEARVLQESGVWEDNPKYDPQNTVDVSAQIQKYFKANYVVHWCPDGIDPSKTEYCIVFEA